MKERSGIGETIIRRLITVIIRKICDNKEEKKVEEVEFHTLRETCFYSNKDQLSNGGSE